MRARLCVASVALLLLPFPAILAQTAIPTGTAMTDREQAELRGPVKTVVAEQTTTFADGRSFVSKGTTDYSPDGRLLQLRYSNPDGSEWFKTYRYTVDGRLIKISSGQDGRDSFLYETYLYDEANRLIATKSNGEELIHYEYGKDGSKTMTESYPAIRLSPEVVHATHWEGTDLGFTSLPGGKAVTSYNEGGVASGAKFYNATGELVGHIERDFDAKGHILSERQIADSPSLLVPEQLRGKLNQEQVKSVGMFIAVGMGNWGNSYTYDKQGRVIEIRKTGGAIGEQVTAIAYNEYGDPSSQTSTALGNPALRQEYGLSDSGAMVPVGSTPAAEPPRTHEMRYDYEYDAHGNWVRQSMSVRSEEGGAFTQQEIHKRNLTYY